MDAQRTSGRAIVAAVACAVLAPFAFLVSPVLVAVAGVTVLVALLAAQNGERRLALGLGVLAALVGIPGLAGVLLVKPYEIPSESMAPSVDVGDRLLVTRFGGGDPAIGDIVVFHPPAAATGAFDAGGKLCGARQAKGAACATPLPGDSEESFIKRVVALGGDRISVTGGHVRRNGVVQDEPFVRLSCVGGVQDDFPADITVPAGHVYLLGDNRQCSEDSRHWGAVRTGAIQGKAVLRYRPLSRLGGV